MKKVLRKRILALTTHTKIWYNRSVKQLGKKIKVLLLQKPSKKIEKNAFYPKPFGFQCV